MTPLISADTGEGAAGWASGSQTCSGSTPALAPKPNTASRKPTEAQNGVSAWARMFANVYSPVLACRTPKHNRIAIAPMRAIVR